jgi:hypothetical protein
MAGRPDGALYPAWRNRARELVCGVSKLDDICIFVAEGGLHALWLAAYHERAWMRSS